MRFELPRSSYDMMCRNRSEEMAEVVAGCDNPLFCVMIKHGVERIEVQ